MLLYLTTFSFLLKVPTCCSCYVKGYSQFFPPIDSNLNGEGKHQERFPGEVILQPDGNLPGDVDGGGHFPNEDLKGPFRNQETSVRQESYPYRQEIRNGYQPNRGQGFGQVIIFKVYKSKLTQNNNLSNAYIQEEQL